MDELLNKLEEELLKRYSSNTVLTFKGFVRITPEIIAKLEKDFNSGLSHCIEIIEYTRNIRV